MFSSNIVYAISRIHYANEYFQIRMLIYSIRNIRIGTLPLNITLHQTMQIFETVNKRRVFFSNLTEKSSLFRRQKSINNSLYFK